MKYMILLLLIFVVKAQEAPNHSLFGKYINLKRQSAQINGSPLKQNAAQPSVCQTPEDEVAFKVSKYYQKIFHGLDQEDNNQLTEADILTVFQNYKWPIPLGQTMQGYVKSQITKYDTNRDFKVQLSEFANLMEDLWHVEDFNKEKDQEDGILKIKQTILRLFDFIDYEKTGLIDRDDLKYAISYIMNNDLQEYYIDDVFKLYDLDKDQKLNFKEFSMSVFNRKLFSGYKTTNQESFLKQT